MTRRIISKEEAIDWINNQIKLELKNDFLISNLQKLTELDINGCNWSASVVVRGAGDRTGIDSIISEAQERFNIE